MTTLNASRAFALLICTGALIAGCSGGVSTATSPPAPSTSSPATTATTTTTRSPTPEPSPTTAPSTTSEPGEPLLVVGDWGSGTEPQGGVAGAMARYAESGPVEAILTTGDNFYADNAEFLMEPFGWATDRGIPFWVVWGNHDIETAQRIAAVNAVFGSPPQWSVLSWGRFDVLILDSNEIENQEQLEFIETEMANRDAPMIVVFHKPPYSCSQHGDNQRVIDNWLPLFDQDVALVLSGHEHNYQRFSTGDIEWVVTGGGGRMLYEVGPCPEGHIEPEFSAVKHHFVVLEDSGDVLTVTAFDTLGDTLDTVSIPVP